MKDVECVVVEFDSLAGQIYSELFDQFVNAVTKISRKKDENVFMLQAGKFWNELKHRLERQARRSSEKYGGGSHRDLESSLSTKVSYYLQQFRQKCGAW